MHEINQATVYAYRAAELQVNPRDNKTATNTSCVRGYTETDVTADCERTCHPGRDRIWSSHM